MNLKNRVAKIEKNVPDVDKVHYHGWAVSDWKEAEGLVGGDDESKEV